MPGIIFCAGITKSLIRLQQFGLEFIFSVAALFVFHLGCRSLRNQVRALVGLNISGIPLVDFLSQRAIYHHRFLAFSSSSQSTDVV